MTDIKIGTQYIPRSDKQKRVHTVIDIHKTYNHKMELVQTRYVAEHEFCGQKVITRDIVQPTIAMGAIK